MIMTDDELLHVLALQHVSNIGDVGAKKLIAHCGSAQAVFKEKKHVLAKIDGIGAVRLNGLSLDTHLKVAEKELEYIKEKFSFH